MNFANRKQRVDFLLSYVRGELSSFERFIPPRLTTYSEKRRALAALVSFFGTKRAPQEVVLALDGILSEESRRMQEMMKMYNMYGMDPSMFGTSSTLVLNANNALVKYLFEHPEGEHTNMICEQLYDLAMISQQPLNPDEMTRFIQRSNDIMMILAK